MKRMTSSNYNPCVNCIYSSSCSHIKYDAPVCPERARYYHLAAIEDILGDDYDLERLRELVEADKDKRCIVLPKDGMMYYIEESDGERWIGNKPIQDIIFLYGWGLASLKCSISEIGETKHFSREAAEAALKGEQDG